MKDAVEMYVFILFKWKDMKDYFLNARLLEFFQR